MREIAAALPTHPLQRIPGVAIVLGLLVVVFGAIRSGFLSPANISNVLVQSTILMMLALPMTLIIMTEGLDLSMGAVLTLTSLFVAIVSLATGSMLIALQRQSWWASLSASSMAGWSRCWHPAIRRDARHARHGAGPLADRQRWPERCRHSAQRARYLFRDAARPYPCRS